MPGHFGLPGNEQRDQQLKTCDNKEGRTGRADNKPSNDAPATTHKDDDADEPKQCCLALDLRDDPPYDQGEADIPGSHEPVLTIELRSHATSWSKQAGTIDEAEGSYGKWQQTQESKDNLERALHSTPSSV